MWCRQTQYEFFVTKFYFVFFAHSRELIEGVFVLFSDELKASDGDRTHLDDLCVCACVHARASVALQMHLYPIFRVVTKIIWWLQH